MRKLILLIPVLFALSCQQKASDKNAAPAIVKDVHSFAEPEKAIVKHLDLELNVDFSTQLISGKASWTIENTSGATEIIFDSRQLQIQKVTLGVNETETTFTLGDEVKYLGQPLRVKIDPSTTRVSIYYSASKDAAAIQWLNPQQTAGKKYPFLFTQSQAILARTWIPCQDSPGIRFTYTAKISVPKDLLAVMSAQNPQSKNAEGIYNFKQPNPIPSYLMALAIGDLEFKSIDGRTGVYAEPVTLSKAAYEFADMGKMVNSAEKIYGPYKWGRYDVIVLPPSFPFGGMENPMLTFLTPTLIAGDRSLVSVIAHELAHSWSGNLVTNSTWNDFWLNEGFTTYFERRIVEDVYGKDEAGMQELLGYNGLQELIKEMGKTNPDTKLKGNYEGRDPDEGVSDIAYEKGYSFLRTIEDAVGRKKFDIFLNEYFNAHAFRSVTSEVFLNDLETKLLKGDKVLKDKIDPNLWVYQPGLPSNSPAVGSVKFKALDTLLVKWAALANADVFKSAKLSSNESLYLISHLPENTTIDQMKVLDQVFKFTSSGNAEIQSAWYVLSIKKGYQPANKNIEAFLTTVGRRKFLMPLYKELVKTPEGKKWAKRIYVQARPNYHSVAYNTIDELLK
ncbi:M1 family metallopeptidase [Daejeonella sp.]|jgi:leukotriene A-4 hydrolase/aminopeptidase|uniref:M1 family metallopeptidase n=1 Tax=Daejeonella sp. TaxID=2805397 RepID=UPI0037C08854